MVKSVGLTSCCGQLSSKLARCNSQIFHQTLHPGAESSSLFLPRRGTLQNLKQRGVSICWQSIARPSGVRCALRNEFCRGAILGVSGPPSLGILERSKAQRASLGQRGKAIGATNVRQGVSESVETEKGSGRRKSPHSGAGLTAEAKNKNEVERPEFGSVKIGMSAKPGVRRIRKGSENGPQESKEGRSEEKGSENGLRPDETAVKNDPADRRGIVDRNPEVRERLQLLRSKYLKAVVKNGVSAESEVKNLAAQTEGKSKGAELLEAMRRNREAENERATVLERRKAVVGRQSDVSRSPGEVSTSSQVKEGAQQERRNLQESKAKESSRDFYTVVNGSKVSKLEARAMQGLKGRARVSDGSVRNGQKEATAGTSWRPTGSTSMGRKEGGLEERPVRGEKSRLTPPADSRVKSAWTPARKASGSVSETQSVKEERVGDNSTTSANDEGSALDIGRSGTNGVVKGGSRGRVSEQGVKSLGASVTDQREGGGGGMIEEGTRDRVRESLERTATKPLGRTNSLEKMGIVKASVARRKDEFEKSASDLDVVESDQGGDLEEDLEAEDDGESLREPTAAELAEEEKERAQFTEKELESGEKLEYSGLVIELGTETDDALVGLFDVQSESESGFEETIVREDGLKKNEEGSEEEKVAITSGERSESGFDEKRVGNDGSRKEEEGLEEEGIETRGDRKVPISEVSNGKPSLEGLTPLEKARILFAGGQPALAAGRETTPPVANEKQPEKPSLEGLTPLEKARLLFAGGQPALAASRETNPPEHEEEVTLPEVRETSATVRRRPPVQKKAPAKRRKGRKEETEKEPIKTRAQAVEYIKQLARDTFRDLLQMRLADRLRVDYIVNHCPKFLARHVLLPLSKSKDRKTPPEEQMKKFVGELSGTQLLTAYEEALDIDGAERESAKKVLAQHLHVHRYLDQETAQKIAYNCPIFLVEGVIIPASTIPIEALSPVQRFHLKMRWRRKQRRPIPKTKTGDEIRDRELAMNYWLCYTKRKKMTWAIFESLGWCESDVIKGRNKVRPGVRLTNLVGVLTWLREEMELSEEELRTVILDNPILMAHSVESFEARRSFFVRKRIGVSEVTQKEWLMRYPRMFTRPVERSLIPMIYEMIEDFGISEAPELLKKYPSVFVRNTAEQLRVKLALLQNLGFTGEDLSRLIRAQDAGPPQNVLCNHMDKNIPPLIKLLKKNGLTERETVEAVVLQVPLLAVDLEEIEARLKFLLWDVDRTPQEIAAFPACLKYPVMGRLQRLVYVKKYGFGKGLGLAELLGPDENEWKALKKEWRGFGNHPGNAAKPETDSKAEELLAQWEEEIEDDPEVEELVKVEETGLVPMDPIRFAPRRKKRKVPIPKVYNLFEQNRIRMPRDPNYHLKVLEKRLAVGLAIERGEEPPKEITEPVFLSKEALAEPSPYGVKVKKVKRKGPPQKGKSPRKKKGKKPKKPLETLFPGRSTELF